MKGDNMSNTNINQEGNPCSPPPSPSGRASPSEDRKHRSPPILHRIRNTNSAEEMERKGSQSLDSFGGRRTALFGRSTSDTDLNKAVVLYSPASVDEDAENVEDRGGLPFSWRKPPHFVAGAGSCIKNVGKGVGLGIGAVIASPVAGYQEDKYKGLAKGIGVGLLAGVVLPTVGVVYGVGQLVRGTVNTYDHVKATKDGKQWDNQKRDWVVPDYSIQKNLDEVTAKLAALEKQREKLLNERGATGYNPAGTVKDMDYYRALDLPPTATQTEIRKQYYKLAREQHPDKAERVDETGRELSDEEFQQKKIELNAKFQLLGEAYQVLGDEIRRKEYDQNGKKAMENMSMMDSGLIFMVMFSSSLLEDYTGEIQLGWIDEMQQGGQVENRVNVSTDDAKAAELALKMKKLAQQKREAQAALRLREKLAPFVEATMNGSTVNVDRWKERIRQEATNAVRENPLAGALLSSVSWAHKNAADESKGKESFLGIGETKARTVRKLHQYKANSHLAWAAASAVIAAHTAEKALKPGGATTGSADQVYSDRAAEMQMAEQLFPKVLTAIEMVCHMEVERTANKAAKKLLSDITISSNEKKLYIEALEWVIAKFEEVSSENQNKFKDMKPSQKMEQFEAAALKAMQKRDAEE